MATSQNGYTVPLTAAGKALTIHYYSLPGGTIGLRKGDAALVLLYVANRFHHEVEALRWPGVWGFAVRPIRGQTSGYSNHASGTAIDLNAPAHPRFSTRQDDKRYRGFTTSQVAQIRRILASCDGAIRWGADYQHGPYDPMHFEINTDSAHLAALADKLRKATTVATTSPTSVWSTQLKNSHDGETASAAAWLVYGNEKAGDARDFAASALKAVQDLTAKLTEKGVI